jgi:hypothetical protein
MNPTGQFLTRSAAGPHLEAQLSRYSLTKVIRHLLNDEPLDGFEAEVEKEFGGSKATAHSVGRTITVPWTALAPSRRDLTAASPLNGGALVGMNVGPAADVLRPYSVAARCGVNMLSGAIGDVLVPGTADEVTFAWLSTEGSEGPNLTPATTGAQMRAKLAAGLVSYSGRLMRSAGNKMLEGFVRRRLLQSAGQLMDRAFLSGGSGGAGAAGNEAAGPLGLHATPGVQRYTVANTADLLSQGINPAMTHVATRSGSDDAAAFVASPTLRELLLPTQANAASALASDGLLQGRALHCTSAMVPNCGAYGDWRNAFVALFGDGIELQIDPFTGFKSDLLTMRCIVAMDVAFPNPNSFAVIEKT